MDYQNSVKLRIPTIRLTSSFLLALFLNINKGALIQTMLRFGAYLVITAYQEERGESVKIEQFPVI